MLSRSRFHGRHSLSALSLALLVLLLAGCSGGGGAAGVRAGRCTGSAQLCLIGCNLGCSAVGCAITEIAQNQPIQLDFSLPIDASSVNAASLSLRTPTGESPTGNLIVNGNSILFVPAVQLIGGATLFGFRANQTYVLSLPGGSGEPQSIRAVSGDALDATITCSLSVTRGVVDLNGQPPVATLLAPAVTTNVPQDTTIVVEFDEIIDIAPFQGATSATSPVQYRLRPSRLLPTGSRQCDQSATPLVLPGVPRAQIDPSTGKTQVILKPAITLPSEVCVEVDVTARVTDLAGNAAVPITFVFLTAPAAQTEQSVIETFCNDQQLDKAFSSGAWSGCQATPGNVGDDGRLGDFDLAVGTPVGTGIYEWNTDSQTIPGSKTISGQSITVTDGVFRFTHFKLPAGQTMRFKGSKPPQLVVRGSCEIDGRIELNAPTMAGHSKNFPTGQLGGAGAVTGGAGGKGADVGDGVSNQSRFNGQTGEDVKLIAGHAYQGQAVGTGGKGSQQFPTDGRWQSITFKGLSNVLSGQACAGGGGGGFLNAGSNGQVKFSMSGEAGPDGIGGIAFSLLPIPAGASIRDHFLVGGSGGGGGGSHPFGSSNSGPATIWGSGAGGAGGGGAIALRIGGDLSMSSNAVIEVKGGTGAATSAPPPAPGGGGAGGSCVLQVGGLPQLGGRIDASGGTGGFTNDRTIYQIETRGGDGSPGSIRLEVPSNASVGLLGVTSPPATANNVGLLTETDTVVGCQSLWYATRQLFSPTFLRYEIQVVEDGASVIYSDDPSWTSTFGPNQGLATTGAPVRFLIQGAQVDVSTGQPDLSTLGGWRTYVRATAGQTALDDDDATGYRFQLLFDRSVKQSLAVKKVTIFFRA